MCITGPSSPLLECYLFLIFLSLFFLILAPGERAITAAQENDDNCGGAHYRQQQKQPGVSHHEQGAKKNRQQGRACNNSSYHFRLPIQRDTQALPEPVPYSVHW